MKRITQVHYDLGAARAAVRDVKEARKQMLTTMQQLKDLHRQAADMYDRLTGTGPTLLTLPREIRDKILEHCVVYDWDFVIEGRDGPYRMGSTIDPAAFVLENYLSLYVTCKQLHQEVAEVWWGRNVWKYRPEREGGRRRMCKRHLSLIRRLSIEYYKWIDYGKTIHVSVDC